MPNFIPNARLECFMWNIFYKHSHYNELIHMY